MLLVILRNLVGNAIKFTLPGGSIRIAATTRDSEAEVAVSDTGVGMTPARLADLFKLDRRLSTTGTAGEQGSGLGLLLCRDLVELQGGHLSVRSDVDHGTTFVFSLPVAALVDLPRLEGAPVND
jgi:two-component system, sensor histidine kinase and response regulator